MKKFISIALVVLMLMATAAIAASAADVTDSNAGADANASAGADTDSSSSGADNFIYFNASGWKNYNQVYAHIWVRGGASFYGWQAKRSQCTKDSGDVWKYDLSKLNDSTDVEGGLKDGVDYCVIFSANTGVQTYDQTFGLPCVGDTAKMTGKMIENAVDSEKEAYESVWTTNSSKYGPHLAISSIGNIIGSVLCPNESGAEVIGDWLPTYYISPNVDAEATLVKALPKFGVKDIQTVYAYILSKETGEDEAEMKKILESAYAKAYPEAEKVVIDEKEAEEDAEAIESGEKKVDDISTDDGGSGDSGSGSGSDNGGSSDSGNGGSGSGNSSGAGADGQETTIFFILAAVMLAAAGVMFVSRKRD